MTGASGWLAGRVDGGSLAVFRIGFGVVMALTAWSWWDHAPRIAASPFAFEYPGLGWAPRLTPDRARWVVGALCVAGLLLAAGVAVRASAAVVWLAWSLLFVQDAATYNNHYYLQLLLAFALIWSPAPALALPALWRRGPPDTRVPRWLLVLLGGQVVLMYVCGGVAKLTHAWLIDAAPMRSAVAGTPLGHPLVAGWSPWALAWAGLLFDLAIGPLLLWRRTRAVGVVLVLAFHGVNHLVLFADIALFPLLGVVSTSLLLAPGWPRRRRADTVEPGRLHPAVVPALALWFVVQLALPLRHWAIAGDVDWTEEGGRFAWRMKASARALTRLRVEVDDPALRAGAGGVYRTVDPRAVDWARLPRLVVIHQPLAGERLIYNSPGADSAAALAAARALWRERFGHTAVVAPTRSLEEILTRATTAGHDVRRLAAIAHALRAERGTRRRGQLVGQLRAALRIAYDDAALGRWLAPRLARVHPFALSGAGSAQRPAIALEDTLVMRRSADGRVRVDREVRGWPRPMVVLVASETFDTASWRELPPRIPFEDAAGRAVFLWNAHRELRSDQLRHLGQHPADCQAYAHHVADRWRARHGHRPPVRMHVEVQLNHRPPRPIIDPEVDLASASRAVFAHNPWIRLYD